MQPFLQEKILKNAHYNCLVVDAFLKKGEYKNLLFPHNVFFTFQQTSDIREMGFSFNSTFPVLNNKQISERKECIVVDIKNTI